MSRVGDIPITGTVSRLAHADPLAGYTWLTNHHPASQDEE